MTSVDDLHSVLDKDVWKLEDIKECLERDSSSVNHVNLCGRTPLLRVLVNKRQDCSAEVAKLLLEFGAEAKIKNDTRYLNAALEIPGKQDIAEVLLEKGAAVSPPTAFNSSSLCLALHCGASKSLVERLLDAGCSTSEVCKHGSVLHCAVDLTQSGLKQDVLQLLIDRGADVRDSTKLDVPVLCYALQKGNDASIIQLLMDAGASLSQCLRHSAPLLCAIDRDKNTPLTAEVVQLLIQSGASVEVRSSQGLSPFHATLRYCNYEMEAIKLLLSFLPDVDPYKQNYLYDAVQNPHCDPAVVELLIKNGVEINNQCPLRKETALHLALGCVHDKLVIKALLENGAVLNHKNEFGQTPIDKAIWYVTNAGIFEELLATGVSLDQSKFERIFGNLYYHNDVFSNKMLFRYFLLQHSFSENIGRIFRSSKYYDTLLRFISKCSHEVQKMKSEQIGKDFTLYDFVRKCASTQVRSIVQQLPRKKYNFRRLLKAVLNDAYPMYFDIISAKVGKDLEAQVLMEEMVERMKVYAAIYPFNSPCVRKIVLPVVVVRNIARFSAGDDLFRFILAFYNSRNLRSTGQTSSKGEE